MSYLVVIIVDDPEVTPQVLEAWDHLGVSGATILESSGMGRIKKHGLRDDIPLMPRLEDFLDVRNEPSTTILSVVESEALVEEMASVAQEITGNLDDPHTGFMFIVPVLRAYGLGRGK
jgi:nitrogen regulatory protein PII